MQCEQIASKCAEISNLYEPLQRQNVKFPPFASESIPVVSEKMVLEALQSLNASKSNRKTDVPAKVLKRIATYISKPLTFIVNNCLRQGCWPDILNRRMRVKWHGMESSERPLPGSSSQGSSFGVLEYLSQSNDSAGNIPSQDKFKFMDDLSILEVILLTNIGLASHNPKLNVPSNIPSHNQFIPSEFLKTQKYLKDINEWTESKKMELNQKKTKSLIFNFTNDKQFTTNIKLKGETVELVKESKLLGVIITNDTKWERNTNHIVKNANKMMRMLHIASKFIRNRIHLQHIYKTFVRSRLEYASTLWHSSLTVSNGDDIERIQKSALKVILKDDY